MKSLIQGVSRFHNGVYRRHADFFEKLASGQHPQTLFITCADSRVDPGLVTQSRPGSLFVLRNAGNLVPPHGTGGSEAGAIELAVLELGIAEIVVCGHSDCGAMKALLSGHTENLPSLTSWLDRCQCAKARPASIPESFSAEQLMSVVERNVLVQMDNLRSHPVVADAIRAARLRLYGWVYDIRAGEVRSWSRGRGRFVPLGQQVAAAEPDSLCQSGHGSSLCAC
jgi:carbonic anhydrase